MSNAKDTVSLVTVPGWPRPKGYANGAIGQGRVLHVAGQIAITPEGMISDDGLVAEFALALDNVLAVVRAAGGEPHHVASMTIYLTDVQDYYESPQGLGMVWRERFGKHFPAMAVVGVTRLYEQSAHVEIQAVAYLPS
jgi:enamine deaminase RidA (YjgF/YER057c/UK114 family)